ncbi:hypothetical protein ACFX13_022478 [Malus domestica]
MSPYSKPVAAKTPSKNDWAGIQTVFKPCDIRECCPYIIALHTPASITYDAMRCLNPEPEKGKEKAMRRIIWSSSE